MMRQSFAPPSLAGDDGAPRGRPARLIQGLLGRLPLSVIVAIPLVLLIVTAVGLTGYLAFQSGQRAVTDLAGQLHQQTAARLHEHLDAYLAVPPLVTELNQDSIRLGQLDPLNLDALEHHFLAQMQRFEMVAALTFASPRPDTVIIARRVLGVELAVGRASADTGGALQGYEITPEGDRRLVASTPDYDPRLRPWYQAAIQAGGPTWTPIFIWSTGDAGLDAVAPVYAAEGALIGVLDTSLTLDALADFLAALPVSENGEAFILERTGLLVASSTVAQPLVRTAGGFERLAAQASGDALVEAATRSLEQQFGTLADIGAERPFYFELAGERQFAWVTPYTRSPGLDWLIVTVIPASDFLAHINAGNVGTGALVATSLLAAVVLAALVARWITQPIERLNRSARALARGDWTERATVDRGGEFGGLAASFNQMADQLQASFASLQASEARARRMAERQTVLYETLRAIVGQLDPDMIGRAAVDAIVRFRRWSSVAISLLDADGQTWVTRAGGGPLMGQYGLRRSLREGVIGRAYRSGQTQLVADVRRDPDYFPATTASTLSELAVPIGRGGQTLGVLNLESDRLADFDAEDQSLAESLADAVALALENARLYAQAQQEIGERRRTEAALRESEARLRALSDNLPGSMTYQVVREPDGRTHFVHVSAAVERLHGLTAAAVLQDPELLYGQLPADDRALVAAAEAASLQSMSVFNVVVRSLSADQQIRWLHLCSAPRRLADGRILWDGIETDITERKQAEEALRQSEAKYRALFQSANDAIFLMQGAQVVDCNARALSMFRCERRHLVGQSLTRFSPARQPDGQPSDERALNLITRALAGTPQVFEWRHTRYDDTAFEAEVNLSRVDLEAGLFLLAVVRDVTERRRLAEERARLVDDLNKRVKELTALHATARRLQQDHGSIADLLWDIVALLPAAWRYPEITAARIVFADEEARTENFAPTAWMLRAAFVTTAGDLGKLEVAYLEARPPAVEGPFLAEERRLIDSLAEMLRWHFERRQAEAALREAEARYRSLTEAAFEGIMIHEQGVIVDANQAFARLSGFGTPEELIGRNGLEIMPFTPETRETIQARIRLGTDEPYEIALVRPDGSILLAETQARDTMYRGRQARVVAMRDITARKRAEAALQRHAQRLEILHEIDGAILAARSPEETALAALTRIRDLVPCRRASVSVFDFEAREARLLAVSVNGAIRLSAGGGISLEAFGLEALADLRAGRAHLVADLQASASSEIDEQYLAEGLRAWLSLPLLVRDELVGSLNLSREEPGPFDPEQVEVAREVADQLAIAIQQSRLLAATERRVQELAGLHEIAQAFSTLADARETFGALAARIAQLIEARRCVILLLGADGVTRAQAPGYGIADDELARWQWRVVDDEIRRDGLERGYFLAPTPDAFAQVARLRNVSLQAENALFESLRVEGAILGHVLVMDKPAGFNADDIRLLGVFAAQAAVVIQNARLYGSEHAARLQADTLLEVARAVSSTLSLRDVLLRILQESARILPFVSGSITVFEDGEPALIALAGHAGREEIIMQLTSHELSTSPIFQRLLRERRPQIIADVEQEPEWMRLPETGYIRSWLGVPLIAQERVIGTLSLDGDRPQAFSAAHLDTAQALAAQAAVAIQNAQLFTGEQHAREQAEVLRAATAAITQSLDLGEVLEAMLGQLHRLVPYDTASVFLVENGTRATIRAARGYERWTEVAQALPGLTFPVSQLPGLAQLVATRQSMLIADTADDPGWVHFAGVAHVRSWIGVPLVAEGRVFGVYSLDKAEAGYFTAAHVRLAEVLSAQGAIAIQNARLFEQVRAGREQLQALSRRLVSVQEEERRHLARELHDEVGQMLTGLKLMLGVLPRLPAETIKDKIGEALSLLNNLTEQVHALALTLRPVILDDLGLTPALLWLFERYTAQTGVRVHFESVGLERRLPAEVETTTYRMVQEALTNVARYAGVTEAWVRLRVEAGELRLQVQDAGRGFAVATTLASGERAGLAGMRERAALLGGRLQVDSTPGGGTHIAATLPLSGRPEGRQAG